MPYHSPDLNRRSFATTNAQTISQRTKLIQEIVPEVTAIGELCCGDCYRQWANYTQELSCSRFLGLDIKPEIVAHNKVRGIPCIQGDVLDKVVMAQFRPFDVLFFGPPLSLACEGHHLFGFRAVHPGYAPVAKLVLGELAFKGTFVCICPKTTTMGDITWLYQQIHAYRSDVNLRLIHHSYATITGDGQETELRLKYIELWFSSVLEDQWEMRVSQPI